MSDEVKVSWLKRPMPRWVGLVIALFFVVLGATVGHFGTPAEVKTTVEYKSLAVEDITKDFKWGVAIKRRVFRDVTTTITDAGTTIVDKTVEHEDTEGHSEGTEKKSSSLLTESKTETTTTQKANWRVGLQVGASLVKPALPITGPLVLGASVEGRIAKTPVSVGVWANTVGAGGASVSIEF